MTKQTTATQSTHTPKRKPRDRKGTERDILATALRLLERDGVLAGLNLREVADEAGVNRGLIYQYYGSRQEVLRAAIAETGWADQPVFHEGRTLGFSERRQAVFDASLRGHDAVRLISLLLLDGSNDITAFPLLDETRKTLVRDHESGHLAADVDPVMAHMLSVATYFGYAIIRDQFARESGISTEDLDVRASATFAHMLRGLTDSAPSREDPRKSDSDDGNCEPE